VIVGVKDVVQHPGTPISYTEPPDYLFEKLSVIVSYLSCTIWK
jgi:hypothetical protein